MKKLHSSLIVILIILFGFYSGYADPQEKHPIDIELEQCLAKDQTTVAIQNCYGIALDEWSKELSMIYQKLLAGLKPEDRELLKKSQSKWEDFHNAEVGFLDSMFLHNAQKYDFGTMHRIFVASDKVSVVRSRTLALKSYLEAISTH